MTAMHRRQWLWVVLALAGAACAHAQVANPPQRPPPQASARAPSPPSSARSDAAAAVPTDARADASAEASTRIAARCRGSSAAPLDLGAVLDTKACQVKPNDRALPPQLPGRVTPSVEAPHGVSSGHVAVIHIVFENRGTARADITLEAVGGDALGGLGGPRPPTGVHPTWGFAASTSKAPWPPPADDEAREGGLVGAEVPPTWVRFALDPSARAVASVVWRATRQGKPLPPGRYHVQIDLPLRLADGTDATFTWIAVTR
jgi:hypothetical protein